MKKHLEMHEYTKVLVPANEYDFSNDKRLLIPFTSGEHIGFVNRNKEVVVQPKYSMYYGDCYSENDYIKVAITHNYGFPRANGKVASYSKPLYGLINYQGEVVVEPENSVLLVSKNGETSLLTIQRKDYGYGVINLDGEEIIPFGKYTWIDGYHNGFARVMIRELTNDIHDSKYNKWGVVDERGEEVIPCIYPHIRKFYGIDNDLIVIDEGRYRRFVPFVLLKESKTNRKASSDRYNNKETYNEYNGSYAQDVMGYSDQTIGDAFEGDPDAYWNID